MNRQRTLINKIIDGFSEAGWSIVHNHSNHGGSWAVALDPLEKYIDRVINMERAKAKRDLIKELNISYRADQNEHS